MPNKLVPFDAARMAAEGKTPGWERGEGNHVIANKKFGVEVVHVMWVDGKGKIQYDQILRAEPGGGVFLPIDNRGRVGLQQQWRPQTCDQKEWSRRFPDIDLASIGRVSYEIPRGAAKLGESGESAARREAQEETQSQVVSARKLGLVNDNTAFSPHFTFVSWGRIDPSRKPADKPDPNEKLVKGVEFFTRRELAELQRDGKLYDAYTLSALGAFWLQNPESFEGKHKRDNDDDDDVDTHSSNSIDCVMCSKDGRPTGKLMTIHGTFVFDGNGVPFLCHVCKGTGLVP